MQRYDICVFLTRRHDNPDDKLDIVVIHFAAAISIRPVPGINTDISFCQHIADKNYIGGIDLPVSVHIGIWIELENDLVAEDG